MILTCPSQFAEITTSPEQVVGFFGILILIAAGLWRLAVWFRSNPVKPDPWDNQVAEEIAGDDAVPLCHRCLHPHSTQVHFCPECGAPVGQYTNLLPFPYLFSMGHTLRIGTSGEFKRSPLTIGGFVLLTLAEYALLAPIYWYVFFQRLSNRPPPPSSSEPPPAEQTSA